MKKILGLVLAALLAVVPLVGAEPVQTQTYQLLLNYDLDGAAASATAIVATADVVASQTYTVAASPDVCRLVDITVTDVNSTLNAGAVTVVGTDCWGSALTAKYTFAGTGSGVKTLTVTSGTGSAAYFKTVTSVTTDNAVATIDAGVDKLSVGYTVATVPTACAYGIREGTTSPAPFGRTINPRASTQVPLRVKNNTSTTLIAVTAGSYPFKNVAVNDLVYFNLSGDVVIRRVTAHADDDNVTLDQSISLPTAGQGFAYKKLYCSADPLDMYLPVGGADTVSWVWEVRNNVDTGGVISLITCKPLASVLYPIVTVDTDTVASAAADTTTVSNVDLRLNQYEVCRFALKFGTNDDADGAGNVEDISATIAVRK